MVLKMARFNIAATIATFFFLASPALTRPTATLAERFAKTDVACDRIERYTLDWFRANILDSFHGPLTDRAVFYTRNMTTQAREYAARQGLTTIWDVWPCELYNHHKEDTNPMRCIHHDANDRTTFYRRMSKVFAEQAKGSVVVMHSEEDYANPPMNGIWGEVEYQVLTGQSAPVYFIAKIKERGASYFVFWQRKIQEMVDWLSPQLRLPASAEPRPQHWYEKRDGRAASCMMPGEYKFFDNIAW